MRPNHYPLPIGKLVDELVSEEPKKRITACENLHEIAKAMGKEKTKAVFVPFLKGSYRSNQNLPMGMKSF